MHSSLAKDAAETADGVGKSLTAAAVVREHGGSGAGALVGFEIRPITISTASDSGRKAASDQRELRARSRIAPTHPRRSARAMLGGGQRTPFPANGKPWPLEASGALALVNTARVAAASCARRKWHGDGPSPCHFRLAARLGCSPSAFTSGGAAEPVAGGEAVNIVQNIADDLLDG